MQLDCKHLDENNKCILTKENCLADDVEDCEDYETSLDKADFDDRKLHNQQEETGKY